MKKFLILTLLFIFIENIYCSGCIYNITDYGAKSDTAFLNTAFIQNAIDICHNNGGGTVYIPTGLYISGTLFLKDNVMLYLERGATIKGSPNLNDYPRLVEHRKGLIHAEKAHRIGIMGTGTIDANGGHPVFHEGPNSPNRIYVVNFEECTEVKIHDVSFLNASFWTLRIHDCEHVQIHGITIKSPTYFNNDGIDLDGRNITVSDCIIDCVDDAICIKSHIIGRPCENIAITNCIVSSNCNAIKFGTVSAGGFKNIAIANCIIKRPSQNDYFDYRKYTIPGVTDNYVNNSGIALELVDGGIFEQVVINNITMYNTLTPIFIRYAERRNPPVGIMKDIIISNVTATANSLMTCSITGIPGHYAENIKLSNIILNCPGRGRKEHTTREIPEKNKSYPENKIFGADLPAYGFYVRHANNITFNNIQFNLNTKDDRHAICLDDCNNIVIDGTNTILHESESAYIRVRQVNNLLVSRFTSNCILPLFLKNDGNSSDIKFIGNDFSKLRQLCDEDTKSIVRSAGNLLFNE